MKQRRFFLTLAILAVIISAGLLYKAYETGKRDKEEPGCYGFPPMVYVNDQLYQHKGEVYSEYLYETDGSERAVYIGRIETSVSICEVPKQNFEANEPIIGAEVYQLCNEIMIINNGSYEFYSKVEEDSDALPTLIYVNDQLYKYRGMEYVGDMAYAQENASYIGKIETVVPACEIPKQNFEANELLILGHYVYRLDDEIITISKSGGYRFYYKYEEAEGQ